MKSAAKGIDNDENKRNTSISMSEEMSKNLYKLSSAVTTPVELDEAKRDGVEPFGMDTAKQLISMEGRGHLIRRDRRKHNAQVTQQQLSKKFNQSPRSVGYGTEGCPENL